MSYLFIVGLSHRNNTLMTATMERLQGIRPHTEYQYKRQFHVFLAFVLHKKFNTWDNITTVLLFLEFLASNSLSHRVILNYVSALKFAFTSYGWNSDIFSHPLVVRLLRGTALSVHTPPSPNGLFSFYQIRDISSLCDLFESSLTCRCAFLLGFYGLLRISNVAPTGPFTVPYKDFEGFIKFHVVARRQPFASM